MLSKERVLKMMEDETFPKKEDTDPRDLEVLVECGATRLIEYYLRDLYRTMDELGNGVYNLGLCLALQHKHEGAFRAIADSALHFAVVCMSSTENVWLLRGALVFGGARAFADMVKAQRKSFESMLRHLHDPQLHETWLATYDDMYDACPHPRRVTHSALVAALIDSGVHDAAVDVASRHGVQLVPDMIKVRAKNKDALGLWLRAVERK